MLKKLTSLALLTSLSFTSTSALVVPGIYWTDEGNGSDGSIKYVPSCTTTSQTPDILLTSPNLNDAQGIDIEMDGANTRVYWTCVASGMVADRLETGILTGSDPDRSITKDSPNSEVIITTNGSGPTGIEIDPTTNNIYWAERTSAGKVRFVDRTLRNQINTAATTIKDNRDQPRDVVIDGPNSKIYWVEKKGGSGTDIYRSNLDGSSEESLFSGFSDAFGITLKSRGSGQEPTLYITDIVGGSGDITKCDLSSITIPPMKDKSDCSLFTSNTERPAGIDLDGNKICWLDNPTGPSRSRVLCANFDVNGDISGSISTIVEETSANLNYRYIALSIPEPRTYAFILGAIALVATMLRRKKVF